MDTTTFFDSQYTDNNLQKLKILLSYMDSPMNSSMGIYIKYKELENALNRKPSFHKRSTNQSKSNESSIIDQFSQLEMLLKDLLPYCNQDEKEKISSLQDMFGQMDSMKDMMEQYEMLKEYMQTDT